MSIIYQSAVGPFSPETPGVASMLATSSRDVSRSDANVASVRRFVENVDSKNSSAERRDAAPDAERLVAEGVRVFDILRACTAADTCSLDSVRIASESDLEMSRLLTVLHRSTPYLLVMFEDGAQELVALSSFFMQMTKLPADESSPRRLPLDPSMFCRRVDENSSLKHCVDLLLQGGGGVGRGGGWEALAVTRFDGSIIGKISLGDVLQRIQDAVAVLQPMTNTIEAHCDDEAGTVGSTRAAVPTWSLSNEIVQLHKEVTAMHRAFATAGSSGGADLEGERRASKSLDSLITLVGGSQGLPNTAQHGSAPGTLPAITPSDIGCCGN